MTTTEVAKPWRRPYGGYHRAVRPQPDLGLTCAGPGTPLGAYMRRFWQPVALASDVGDRPFRLRIMNEDLVLFRDRGGRYGLLHLHCAHRGTSLEFAIPQAHGLRCCYHGWTYDVDGTCLETPGEPGHSKLKETTFQGAYPVRDLKGMIFAYMGPPDELPDFPLYDALEVPRDNPLVPYALDYPCNWLQSHENGADPIHTAFLHAISSGVQFTPAFSELPIIEYFETPIGMVSTATRRKGDNIWIRASDVIMPNSAQFGSAFVDGTHEHYAVCSWATRWIVPVDDTHNLTIGFRHFNRLMDPEGKGDPKLVGRNSVDFMGQTPDRGYAEQQAEPGDYEAQVGQGPIAVHAAETLASTDRGVLMARRMLRQGIKAVATGAPFKAPRLDGAGVVATYNHEIVHRCPARGTGDDRDLLAEFGHRVGEIVLASASEPPAERQARVEARIRAEF